MKVLLVCILIVGALFFVSQNRSIVKPAQALLMTHSASSFSNDTVSFKEQIQPILVSHCSPCHFTGGKMYERLPFDKGETIVDHDVALLRRINDEKEKALIQKFVSEQKK
ncbi:MAG: hypothetical protein ABJA71_13725 [Ginsengibacter sp.]